MAEISEIQKKEISIESEIKRLINCDNGVDVSFQYENDKLNIITFNPRHNAYFLLESISNEKTKYETLTKALDLLKHKVNPKFILTYELEWYNKSDEIKHVSHFNGFSLEDVVKKFYFKNNCHDYIIFSAILKANT